MNVDLSQVGPRLRALRHQQGLTLEELAFRASISVSTLSRLESSKRQATLELLVPLTRLLGVRIDDLLTPKDSDPRIRATPVHQRGLITQALSPPHAPIRTFKITYLPNRKTPLPKVHDGYEWLYVLSGRLVLSIGEREVVLRKGEAAEFDTRTPHAMSALGGRPAEVISIFNEDGERFHTHVAEGIPQT